VLAIKRWAQAHIAEIEAAQAAYDERRTAEVLPLRA